MIYLFTGKKRAHYWTRRHQQMTRAYVINIPASDPTATTTPILPNW